jgi:hypothetical protein
MPRRKGICRELKSLAASGGKAGHMFGDSMKWTFDDIPLGNQRSIVAPAVGNNCSTNDNINSGSEGDTSKDVDISTAIGDDDII